MNLILIGYRGTGKSSVAGILGEKLGKKVISVDEEIVKKIGMTISAFVEKNGWEKFRTVETNVLKNAITKKKVIIDCGGGIIEKDENFPLLKKGKVIWCTADVETIVQRIKDSKDRPSLTGKSFTEEVEEVLERRNPKYRRAADIIIKTDHLSVQQQSREIIKKIK